MCASSLHCPRQLMSVALGCLGNARRIPAEGLAGVPTGPPPSHTRTARSPRQDSRKPVPGTPPNPPQCPALSAAGLHCLAAARGGTPPVPTACGTARWCRAGAGRQPGPPCRLRRATGPAARLQDGTAWGHQGEAGGSQQRHPVTGQLPTAPALHCIHTQSARSTIFNSFFCWNP